MIVEYPIDNFAVRQWSSRSTSRGSAGVAVAGIYLYEGDSYRGYIYFYPDGTALRAPLVKLDEGQVQLHFNLSQMRDTIEMLNSDEKVSVFFASSTDAGLKFGKDPFAMPVTTAVK